MTDWPAIAAAFISATRQTFQFANHIATSGGSINQPIVLAGRMGGSFS